MPAKNVFVAPCNMQEYNTMMSQVLEEPSVL